jgi:hypothetical protein
MEYSDMIEALEKQFDSDTNIWQLRQKLIQRKQSESELLSNYVRDIRKMCMRLDLPKEEWVYYFIHGLKPSLRAYVILQKPTDFDTAVDSAKLKDSVEPNNQNNASAKEISEAVTEQIKKLLVSSKPTVAAFGSSRPNIPAERRFQSQSEMQQSPDLRKIVREEIQKAMPRRENITRRNDNFRSRRTGRGGPICNNCGKIGHTYFNCRDQPANRNSQNRYSRAQNFGNRISSFTRQSRWQSGN